MLKLYFDDTQNYVEAGIDEAGRGCLAGRVYVAAVILDPSKKDDELFKQIKDSKKIPRKKRNELRKYIEENSLAFSVQYAENTEIDKINILQATLKTMHKAIKNLSIKPEILLVDGNQFHTYTDELGEVIPHQLIKGGDNLYYSIAAASILAKEYHDDYIKQLCKDEPDLNKYDWCNNMAYGTEKHRNAIKEHGISEYHRKTYGICKNYK